MFVSATGARVYINYAERKYIGVLGLRMTRFSGFYCFLASSVSLSAGMTYESVKKAKVAQRTLHFTKPCGASTYDLSSQRTACSITELTGVPPSRGLPKGSHIHFAATSQPLHTIHAISALYPQVGVCAAGTNQRCYTCSCLYVIYTWGSQPCRRVHLYVIYNRASQHPGKAKRPPARCQRPCYTRSIC